MAQPEKRTISQGDFYKLTGLLALAQEHERALHTIAQTAAAIVGEEPDEPGGYYFGHTNDAISENYSAGQLLAKLGIEVE